MNKSILKVNGMSCEHCERAVKQALTEAGATGVLVDLPGKTVTVSYPDGIALEKLVTAVEDIGYDVVE